MVFKKLATARPWQPIIARVAWSAGGGHAVLVDCAARRTIGGETFICVCDPANGVRCVELPDSAGEITYSPTQGATGTFDGRIIVIS